MTKQLFRMTIAFFAISFVGKAQLGTNNITTAVPFLLVSADARSAGLADQGVATSPDVFSQQWNSSKYAFAPSEMAIGVNVTPYLTKLVNDIILANLSAYKRLPDGRSAIAVGFRYFSLGEIDFTNEAGERTATEKPNELNLDVSYALKLSDNFSMSVAGRYLRSDLRLQSADIEQDANAGNSFGVDITGFYQSNLIRVGTIEGRWRGGFAVSNIGPKMSYSEGDDSNFLPTNFRFGAGLTLDIDDYNSITPSVEFSKLLVPTPDENGDQTGSAIGSIFSSLGDAPGGFSEELQEVTMSIGAEYSYNDVFALRLGYFNENENKGARKFFALGAGFKYTSIGIDMSYLFSTSSVPSPLEGTLRFGLTFNLGEDMRDYNR